MTRVGFLRQGQGFSSFIGFKGGSGCPSFSWEYLVAWSNVLLHGRQSIGERRLCAAMLPLEGPRPWRQNLQGVMLASLELAG